MVAVTANIRTSPSVALQQGSAVVGGRYRIDAPMSSAGRLPMFQACDLRSGEPVAVTHIDGKTLAALGPPNLVTPVLRRALGEAAALQHPHIGQPLAFSVEEAQAFVVTIVPHFIGLDALAGCAPRYALRFGAELLDALHFAHRRGITHGCLEADSVGITAAGQVKIIQFGLHPILRNGAADTPPGAPMRDIVAAAQLLLEVLYSSGHPLDPLAGNVRDAAHAACSRGAFHSADALRRVLDTALRSAPPRADAPLPEERTRPNAAHPHGIRPQRGHEDLACVRGGLLRSPQLGDVLHQPVCIQRRLVTNADFEQFVAATREPPPLHWRSGTAPPARRDHPVVNVSAEAAARYAEWCGLRLPTAVEWEAAATRGGSGWPWGSTWDPARLNGPESGVGDTTPVGAYPSGASSDGVLDLLGNVWEWVDPSEGLAGPEEGYGWVYGGSFRHRAQRAARVARATVARTHAHDHVGFRCALSWDRAP